MDRHVAVFLEVFACAEIHASVYLSRVGTDDFSVDGARQVNGPACLA